MFGNDHVCCGTQKYICGYVKLCSMPNNDSEVQITFYGTAIFPRSIVCTCLPFTFSTYIILQYFHLLKWATILKINLFPFSGNLYIAWFATPGY
jgi:hypothetical protein